MERRLTDQHQGVPSDSREGVCPVGGPRWRWESPDKGLQRVVPLMAANHLGAYIALLGLTETRPILRRVLQTPE